MPKPQKLSQKVTPSTSSNSIMFTGIALIAFTVGILMTVLVMVSYQVNFTPSSTSTNPETVLYEQECLDNNGVWEQKGGDRFVCNYETEDASGNCTDSSDCEGWCLAEQDSQLGEKEIGECSDYKILHGCIKFIDKGMVNSICLP